MQTTKPQEEIRYQCRHIFTDGHRCASPCLKAEDFCYYHHTTRRPITPEHRERREANKARHTTFELPLLEDRSSIQAAIGEVLRRIASNELDPRRAGLLLYGLQIASMNFPRPTEPKSTPQPAVPIEEITTDPIHGTLAPRTEIRPPKGFFDDFLEELRQSNATPPKPTSPEPNILPDLQAAATEPAAVSYAAGSSELKPSVSKTLRTNCREGMQRRKPDPDSITSNYERAPVAGTVPHDARTIRSQRSRMSRTGRSGETMRSSIVDMAAAPISAQF